MIRIELGKEVSPGIWAYAVPSLQIEGRSRQPLLDACRRIELTGDFSAERCGLFREGRSIPDLSCPVATGAALTVSEPAKGGIRFEPYREFTGVPS